jgi:hypothetical protein
MANTLQTYCYLVLPTVVVLAVYLLIALWKRHRDIRANREQERADEEAEALLWAETEKAEAKRRARILGIADGFLRDAREMLTPCLVIDSSIWMSVAYEAFFAALKILCVEANYVLPLSRAQFDDMAGLRATVASNGSSDADCRLAFSRIEALQKLGLLRMEPLPHTSAPSDASEPLIVRILAAWAAAGKSCTYISDDKELRVRVREFLSHDAQIPWRVVEMEAIMPSCRAVVEALRYRVPSTTQAAN